MEDFLKFCYGIISFDDAIEWINANNIKPWATKLRVLDAAWTTWGDEESVSDSLVELYITIITELWLPDMFHLFEPYIKVVDGKIAFSRTPIKSIEYSDIKRKFFIDKFVNKNNIYKFLLKYAIKKQPELHDYWLRQTYQTQILQKLK